MGLSSKWLVLWSLWAARLVRQPTAPLRVSGGWLAGSVAPSGLYAQYSGVPYATITQRFQDPGPEPKWEGIFEANDEHIRCTQRTVRNGHTLVSGQENCLTLNIYTPLAKSPTLYPVMVFIHGGGYREGSGSSFLYGPKYLIQHGVVLVTINYRLEILGFLCLGTHEAPGNAGLKDQVAALKWVKKNIKAFRGDPDNVTIFGESAGATSVMYHMVSPMSRNLFHKAIMQSGSAISPWSLQFEPLKTASLLAQQMGYETRDPHEIHKLFMSKRPYDLITTRVPRTRGDIVLSENIFVPCVEKKITNVEQFLPDSPYNLIASGQYSKVPVILGHNNAEGYMFAAKETDATIANMNFYDALPRDLVFPNMEERNKTAVKLKELYMGDEEISKDTLVRFSFYEGDSAITFPMKFTTDLLSKTGSMPLFSYKMCYDGWLNLAKMVYGFGSYQGATHADELFYMFNVALPLVTAFYEKNIIDKITTLWTNFAKYSDPTPEATSLLPVKWPPADKQDLRSLVIDKEFSMAPLWDSEIMLFWNNTYSKYRRK